MLNFSFLTPKRHFHSRNHVVLSVKVRTGLLTVGDWKNQKTKKG